MSLVRQAAKALFAAADFTVPSLPGPRILIYHQVGAETGKQTDLALSDFAWQVDWLATNREVVELEIAIGRWDEPGSDRLAVVTFDDGYRDTFTTAFPILSGHKIPFTLYLSTERIGSGDERFLDWDQIGIMLESGLLTIGSHTHTHADLRHLDEEKILNEIGEADNIIQRRLGIAPNHFAYPWGYWSEPADRIVRERYHSAALGAACRAGSGMDTHRLHRFPVQLSDGKRWFRPRLKGGFVVEERVRRRLRGYRGP
jgi:hypothetical protein